MPHAHHATAVTDDTFSVIGDRPHFTIIKSNLQLYKIMTDVLWVYPDNCSSETYSRLGGIYTSPRGCHRCTTLMAGSAPWCRLFMHLNTQ